MSLHHSFDIAIAIEFSMEESVIIHHFQHWIRFNRDLKRNFHEDRTWSYQTLIEISNHFPYLSKKQIERTINKLVKKEVLIKNNFNKSRYDRTVWYAFKNQEKYLPSIDRSRFEEMEKTESRNDDPDIGTPIPHTKPYAKTKERETPSPPFTHKKIKMPKAKHEALIKDFGEEATLSMMDKLDEYGEINPTKFKTYACHAAIMRKWAREDAKKDQPRVGDFPDDAILLMNMSQHEPIANRRDIIIGANYIDFSRISGAYFKIGEPGFREKVLNTLRKIGIPINARP